MDEVGVEGDAFRLIFDVNPRPMLVFDRETLELLTINEAACALYGWSRDELLAMTIREIRRSEDVPDLDFALAHERRHSKQSFARYSRHVTKDGRELDVRVELTRILFRGRPSVLAVITDLTGTADVERRFRILVEHSAEGICVVDENGAFVYLSPGAERIVGVQSGELVGVSSSWLVHPDDLAGLKPPADGETVFDVYRGRHKDGSWRWLESSTTNLLRDAGMRAYVSNVRDVTDRMTADLSLRRSESNFRTLIERLPMATVVHRLGRIIYVNPAAAAMLGYDSVDGVVGRPVFEIVHPDDHDHVRARIELMQRDGGAPPQEVRILRSDGSVAIVEAEGVMLDFDGQPANVVLARDISERRELFARIAMADRMLSVGTLAAGVAHEINNPLAYVVSNLEVLANELPELLSEQGPEGSRFDRDEVAALIAEAREGAERVSAIVRDLRSLSRPANDTLAPVDVVGVLSSSIRMANNELKHRARVIQTYAADLPRVRANASRLGQVFVNLLINAAHAIDEGHAETNEVRVRASSSADRKSVIVEIEDTGAGMPPKIVARIFDPFFTTKPVGVGIGLGLSISHQIVQSIGGEMSVTSTVGQGTTFRVTLRASVAEPFLEPVETTGSSTPPLRILMIDDEAAVGRAVRALLEPDHEVVPVTRAKTALSRLVAGETFDVILCDLMMPEMSGIEFYMELVRLVPHYQDRVVFVTGGAFTEQAREFLARTKHTRIEKPFTEEQLRRAIDSVSNSTT